MLSNVFDVLGLQMGTFCFFVIFGDYIALRQCLGF